jgi:trigger factor
MFSYKKKDLGKHTLEYSLEIEWSAIAEKKEKIFSQLLSEVTVPGFRKGKAPREQAARYVNHEKLYDRVVRDLIPEVYRQLIQKEDLSPITSPAIELVSAKEDEPWRLTIQVALVPEVQLMNYQDKVKELNAKLSEKKKEDTAQSSGETSSSDDVASSSLDQIFTLLLEEARVEIPDLLIKEEVNRRLTQLVDDVRRVGMTMDQYLSSKKLAQEDLRTGFARDAEDMYKIEFILAKIADVEGITVSQADLDAVLNQAKTESERSAVQRNLAWYKGLLRKQKVIDFLKTL